MRLGITHWKNDKTLQNPACLLTEIYYSNEKLSCTGGSTQRNLTQLLLRDNTASAPPFRIAGRLTEARRGDSSMQRTSQSHRSLHSHSAWRGESFMGCSAAEVVRFLWDWKLMLVSLPLCASRFFMRLPPMLTASAVPGDATCVLPCLLSCCHSKFSHLSPTPPALARSLSPLHLYFTPCTALFV